MVEGKVIEIVKIPSPTGNYMILDNISREENVQRSAFVIKGTATTNVNLGRGHNCDIRISDISVSR